jgi:hypothetical protein
VFWDWELGLGLGSGMVGFGSSSGVLLAWGEGGVGAFPSLRLFLGGHDTCCVISTEART